LQRFVKRTAKSKWSQVNREKVEELTAAGRMKPSGLEEVRRAKADGRWEAAYPAQSQAPVPPDLQTALDANPEAKAFFETLRGQRRYAFLYRLHNVKRPESRAKRIANYIELLNAGKTLHD
ncbi:MAG TPA: YdeI/OmpD-associated family protein, partial [Nocardioides sp.]|nr:YdeI/OmpD-associated family protein [Nocardioides sp.]